MSRTIRLTRIHALNWYGYKDSILVEGNLLLAGVTGSGKSILMDLIQLVLVGDQRLVRFNQSATGDRSDRSLKGYSLGDTKQEENGVTQYMRQSAITYVALEFTWPNGKRAETWGLRIEFTSAAEAHGKITPFFIPAAFTRGDFLDVEKRPLDYTAFKALAESRDGRLYTEGLDAYLRDMAQPTHLNFDRAVLRALLPTAMSFTFLKSFNDFARNFILPADKLDVSDVTASYRTFLGYEEDLNKLNDQFGKLKVIRSTFIHLTELRRDRALARYLEAQLRHEHVSELLVADETRLITLKAEYAGEAKRLKELDEMIERDRAESKKIDALIGETPEGQLYKFIKTRNAEVSRQISQLGGIGTTLEQALANRIRNARAWLKNLRALPLELEATPVNAVERAIQSVTEGGIGRAGETLSALGTAAQSAASAASRAAKSKLDRLADVRRQLGLLRDEIAALKIGKLPFPTHLLDALNSSLLSRGSELPARQAGRTGEASRDVLVDVEDLLRDAGTAEGEARAVAEQQLREAEKMGILKLEPLHKRDPSSLHQVRFSPANEIKLYENIGGQSPKSVREALADQFAAATSQKVPARWNVGWQAWCERLRGAALAGRSVEPFDRQWTPLPVREYGLFVNVIFGEDRTRIRTVRGHGQIASVASIEPDYDRGHAAFAAMSDTYCEAIPRLHRDRFAAMRTCLPAGVGLALN